jgi:flagellar basal body L-ring protein FlgH
MKNKKAAILNFLLMAALAMGALAGCAALEEAPVVVPKPVVTVKKPAARELGSLWSEDSMWNHVYTAAAARVVGDIVSIRLDEAFQKRLLRLKPESGNRSTASETGSAPGASGAVDPNAGATTSELVLRGTIDEVGPRGIYKISATDTLRMGNWEPYIVIKGRVRDRDINVADEVQVANVVDLGLEVLRNPPLTDEQAKGAENVSW